jgi:hypothetical protein
MQVASGMGAAPLLEYTHRPTTCSGAYMLEFLLSIFGRIPNGGGWNSAG